MEDRIMGIKDIMEKARISQTTALRWVKDQLPDTPSIHAFRIGRQWRVMESDLVKALSAHPESVSDR